MSKQHVLIIKSMPSLYLGVFLGLMLGSISTIITLLLCGVKLGN